MNPHPSLPAEFGEVYGHRRLWREFTTQEIAIRTNDRRRRVATRAGVLILFTLSMVVYPILGTLSPAFSAVSAVDGVVMGEVPETMEVLLGEAPTLREAALPLPTLDDQGRYLATSSEYIVSTYLPDCDGSPIWEGTNGALTADSMCTLWDGQHQVRSDAAVALAQLNHDFRLRFGRNLCIISSYRTLADQYRILASRGWRAATPGRSYHGWGLAIDLCGGDDRGERFEWLKENAPAYGWDNPPWASTVKYEPWHWEYVPGTDEIGWYLNDELLDEAELAAAEGSGDQTEVPDVTDPGPDPTPSAAPEPSPTP